MRAAFHIYGAFKTRILLSARTYLTRTTCESLYLQCIFSVMQILYFSSSSFWRDMHDVCAGVYATTREREVNLGFECEKYTWGSFTLLGILYIGMCVCVCILDDFHATKCVFSIWKGRTPSARTHFECIYTHTGITVLYRPTASHCANELPSTGSLFFSLSTQKSISQQRNTYFVTNKISLTV